MKKVNTLEPIRAFVEKLMHLKTTSYVAAEDFFTDDFNYLTKAVPQSKNMIFNFLDDLNNAQYQYEIEKIKTVQQTVYLVYLKCTNRRWNNMEINTLFGTDRILLIIKQLETGCYLTEAIDFKNNETNPIYTVLKNLAKTRCRLEHIHKQQGALGKAPCIIKLMNACGCLSFRICTYTEFCIRT